SGCASVAPRCTLSDMKGRRPTPANLKLVRRTLRRDRVQHASVLPLDGTPKVPTWLRGTARRLFVEKCDDERRREQSDVGCEAAHAQNDKVEAMLIEWWGSSTPIPAAWLNLHRLMCSDFKDNPASQVGAVTMPPSVNAFRRNGVLARMP